MIFDLTHIRTYVLGEINQSDADSYVTNADIDRWANEAYFKYAHMLMENAQGYFEQSLLLDITADDETVALPDNFNSVNRSFLKAVRLERVLTSANVPLQYRRRQDESNPTSGVSGAEFLPSYDFRGGNIILEPQPSSSETNGLKLIYRAIPPELRTQTAQAGGATTITLDAAADPRNDYYNNARIYIVSGTGAGQTNTITDYVGSTKVATVAAWGTEPDSTSVFSILIHPDFPESFHMLIALYAAKKAFSKERSRGIMLSYDAQVLKELEKQFTQLLEERTDARKFVEPFHIELD